ncbi:hypothetical protein PCANB_002116 [Pneumocystis canis]|nr:hypothetical protein PCANB_002116 [Pneumocystis canis]
MGMHDISNNEGRVSSKVKVRIKSSVVPYLSEFAFEVDKQLTVGALKNQISTIFKEYVDISGQQLILGDRIMENNQEIGQFIKDDSSVVAFRLIAGSEISLSSNSFNKSTSGSSKTEQNLSDDVSKLYFDSEDCKKLPIYYQAALLKYYLDFFFFSNKLSNEPCLLKVSKHPKKRCQILLIPPENISQHLDQNVQNNSQFPNTSVNSNLNVQDPGVNNERLRMTFVHLWLFIRLVFFVGLFSVNSSWIRFCTLLIIVVWHTGRLLNMRLFFQRIINRGRDQNSLRNGQSSLETGSGISQPISYDQEDYNQHVEEFNWRRNLGYRILIFVISLFPLTE